MHHYEFLTIELSFLMAFLLLFYTLIFSHLSIHHQIKRLQANERNPKLPQLVINHSLSHCCPMTFMFLFIHNDTFIKAVCTSREPAKTHQASSYSPHIEETICLNQIQKQEQGR